MFPIALFLVLSGAPQVTLALAESIDVLHHQGRHLHQDRDGSQARNITSVTSTASMFNLSEAEGIASIGAWIANPAFNVTCDGQDGPYAVGPDSPQLCIEQIEAEISSELFGNVTVVFDAAELNELRSIDTKNPNAYVYALPLSKYAVPNALYETAVLNVKFDGGSLLSKNLPSSIFNYFNASATTLREYYGIDSSLQGSEEIAQGSALFFGVGDSAVNQTAASEYLELQGLIPNVPLQIPDWAPENNLVFCEQGSDCVETMLDVQAQQSFAPQAVTYFAPTELAIGAVEEAAREAGFTDSEIEALARTFSDPQLNPQTELDSRARDVVRGALKSYFSEFVNNVTSSDVQVVSFSWSADYTLGSGDFEFFEEALKNLTLSGTTIMFGSGDGGASGLPTECYPPENPLLGNQNGKNYTEPMTGNFAWPWVSPWVTVVGGTQFLATADNPQAQVVCSGATKGGITSGGGFAGPTFPSDLFSRPAYQEKAVQRYLAENNASTFAGFPTKDTPGWNPNGRAFPDIAAYAGEWPILAPNGKLVHVAGTSLAAPMAAAIFSLANQVLLRDGYQLIGYANPMIYWMGENCREAFFDVTEGNNQAAAVGKPNSGEDSGEAQICLHGFPAAPGWDAATGMGSINFGSFVQCAKRYQDEVRNKGLEVLPDGSYRAAPVSTAVPSSTPSPGPEERPETLAVALLVSVPVWLASLYLMAV